MRSIKSYQDGSRLILVLENCTGELAAKVNAFLLDVIGMADPEPIPAIIPQKVVEEEPPVAEITTEITPENPTPFKAPAPEEMARNIPVEGEAGTLGRAIEIGDTATVVKMCVGYSHLDESLQHTVIRLCKEYIRRDCLCKDPDCTSSRDIKKFFNDYKPLIENGIRQILDQAGYGNLQDFFELTDEYIHQDAFRGVINDLLDRVS